MPQSNAYNQWIKRTIDKIAALLVLIVTLPIMIVIAIILIPLNKGKVFFLHERVGKSEELFLLIKFRTMIRRNELDKTTLFGAFLRKLSLDELPQLVNVIKGEMSIVGPRPLLVEYLPHYNATERKRHDVYPGITGWAQVRGRNQSSWEKRMSDDVYYADHQSLWLDLKILLLTVIQFFKWKQADFEELGQETFTQYAKRR